MTLKSAIATSAFPVFAAMACAMLAGPAQAEGDAAAGAKAFGKCRSCHLIASAEATIVNGGKTGPNLYGVIGRQAGTGDFRYGRDLAAAGEAGLVWSAEALTAYIQDPRKFLQTFLNDNGAKSNMKFKMKAGAEDVAAYLASAEAGATN